MTISVTVSQLFIHPVKSLPGLSVPSLQLDRIGAVGDRRYLLVDAEGKFLSQRQESRLALIHLAEGEGGWLLSCEGGGQRFLPKVGVQNHKVTVTVWNDSCEAFDQGDAWAAWFSAFLGKPARLVYTPPEIERRIDRNYCADERHVSFADAYPLLVVSESSLNEINRHLSHPIGINRFRSNVVVTGSAAFAEDGWRALAFGENRLALVKPCSRCVIPTINPATAGKEREVWLVLEKLRKRADGKIYFGQNAIHQQPGELRVGDKLAVVSG